MSATAVSAERSGAYRPVAKTTEHVWLDEPVRASLDRSVAQIGAPEAWAAGHTGVGSTVAVLDSGIDAKHPDMAGAIVGEPNITDSDTVFDRFGHGTHVASTITGDNDKYRVWRQVPSCSTARCSTTPAGARPRGSSPAWSGPRPAAPMW